MPGFHMPDGQINVNIKNLEQLVARYPSIKGYAIDSKETTLHTVSYSWFVNLEGNPQAMDYLQ